MEREVKPPGALEVPLNADIYHCLALHGETVLNTILHRVESGEIG